MQSPTARLTEAHREVTPLAALLTERIRSHSPITFADYMEACIYHPQHGYYCKSRQEARRDYFTSVDAGPVFGYLLARQFEEMWISLGQPHPFLLVEVGAGAGVLAKHVLDFAAESTPEFYAALHYVAVERSEARRASHSQLLAAHVQRGRFSTAGEVPDCVPAGCIFSNELLDAMPVHRVVQWDGKLQELYVTTQDTGFGEQLGPLSSTRIVEYFAEQGIRLKEGQQAEVSLKACDWIQDVGKKLRRGFILTIDYGRKAYELYDERHMRGTMLAYERHRSSECFYSAPGEQDLTAHVNFTALDVWGAKTGLIRTGLASQSNFLLALARKSNWAEVEGADISERETLHRRLLFKTLIYPEGMGETFNVLVQHKGLESPRLSGLEPL